MLSFDITDRNIRIIRGAEANGKIRINSATTLLLEEEVIINGHCKDIPRLATLINGELKSKRMSDKEAVISISSNMTIFKEITVPKAKDSEFTKMVKSKMQQAVGIDDQYGISYVVVGEVEDENGNPVQKVLATACPYEVVDCYRKVFAMLGIALKSVLVGCNCITKVLLADERVKTKMPLLAVQIDNTFINLNLYEDGQLSFSRFASIDPADYDNSEDYVFEAVNENVFRMIQFQRNRNPQKQIENVIFYGDTHEYVRLTNALEQMDITSALINVPRQVSGYENIEFAMYANAVGALFKRNKETEHVNLLDNMEFGSVVVERMKSDKSFPVIAISTLAVTCAAIGGVWMYFNISKNKLEDEKEEINTFLASPQVDSDLKKYAALVDLDELVSNYYTMIQNAGDAYTSLPIIKSDVYNAVDTVLSDYAAEKGIAEGEAEILIFDYSGGQINLEFQLPAITDEATHYAQEAGAIIVKRLQEIDFFEDVDYSGYSIRNLREEGDPEEGIDYVAFNVAIVLKGDLDGKLDPEETTAVTTEEVAK